MVLYHSEIVCLNCGARYPKGTLYSCNKCGGILDVSYDYENIVLTKSGLKSREDQSIWRFRELLPVSERTLPISLCEGFTPLLRAEKLGSKLGLRKLLLKDETRNPTGSFKDRALSVAITCAIEQGARKIVSASSGNAAAAASAYSAKAGLPCYLLFDSKSPPTKHLQPLVYGAKGLSVRNLFAGTSEDLKRLLKTLSERLGAYNVFCWSLINPYPVEGLKTATYEICMDLGWKSPDVVLVPVGGGDNLFGQWKGYKEMYRLGLVKSLPRMIGVQSGKADPLVRAWKRGSKTVNPIQSPSSLASGINVPYSGDHALGAIKESKGAAISVDDEEIVEAEKKLARLEGIWAEPSSSSVVAALPKVIEEGVVDKDENIICVLTGSGLKDTRTAQLIVQQAIEVENNVEEIMKALAS